MQLFKRGSTLHMRWPLGQTLGLALIFIVLTGIALELFARTEFSRSNLPVPGLGSSHHQLELQVARLELLVEQNEPVDCLFLGSSLVWLGFNPEAFAEAYKQQTGQDIHCFNFGIETLPANGAGALAKILVKDYRPKLFIYGVSARDYAVTREAEDSTVILDTPWVRYRTGIFSVKGWLFTHSYLYRQLQNIRSLLYLDLGILQSNVGSSFYDLHGSLPKRDVAKEVNIKAADENALRWLYEYEIQPENVRGLEQVIEQNGSDVHLIVVEMPVQQSYFGYFANGKQDYDQFINMVSSLMTINEVPFLQASSEQNIPADGWWDKSHLNMQGASAFSQWLGREIGKVLLGENPSNQSS